METACICELGLSYEETAKLTKGVTTDTKSLRPLWEKFGAGAQRRSQLPEQGIALTAFTIPTIDIKRSLGTILIAAGLVQERMKHTHVADVYTALQNVHSEIRKPQQK